MITATNIANRVILECEEKHNGSDVGGACCSCARKIARLAANDAIERAAKVADSVCANSPTCTETECIVRREVAAAIRALKETP